MHSNRRFHWNDRDAMLDFIAEVSFAHIFAQTPDGPKVAHAPINVTPDKKLRFHLSRANALSKGLDGSTALVSVGGPGTYVSPDWYVSEDQVPTWNYIAVEASGPARRLDETGLVAHLDALSAAHESRLLPKRPWTRAKMTPGRFEAMLPAIIGFELKIVSLCGTTKLSQNKSDADAAGVITALESIGQGAAATLIRRARTVTT